MRRGLRLDVEGGVYHVMARGVERRAIFHDDTDRQNFLRRLEAVAEEEDLAVFAYVLMENHFHVVARRGAARPLSAPPVDGPHDSLASSLRMMSQRFCLSRPQHELATVKFRTTRCRPTEHPSKYSGV